jgi:hypothetical protein
MALGAQRDLKGFCMTLEFLVRPVGQDDRLFWGTDIMNRTTLARSLAGSGFLLAVTVTAPVMADGEPEFSLGLQTGISSDSNVGVAGVNQSGDRDTAYHFGLDAGVTLNVNSTLTLNAGYDYSTDQYVDFDQFSQQNHSLSAGARTKLENVTLGLTYTYIATLLDGDSFLDMQVISPSISGFVADKIYVRAAYSRYEKEFEVLSARDASTDIVTVDTFFFFDGYRSYLDLRATVEQEDADTDPFDYSGYSVGATLSLALDGFGRENTLELGTSYRDRDYDNITPSIGTERQDENMELKVGLEIPLNDTVYVRADYKYADHKSNLAVSNNDEQIVSIEFGIEF